MNQKELDTYIHIIVTDFASLSRDEFKQVHKELYPVAYDKIDASIRKAILSSIPVSDEALD